jgi:uncharacterized protein (TIGR01244 family)
MPTPRSSIDAPAVRRRGLTLRTFAILIGLIAFAFAARWAHWRFEEHRFRTIAPGQVYQSAQMPMDDLLETVDDHGIRTVIDLREEPYHELSEERRALEAAGVRYVNLPTPQVPEQETVDTFLDLVGRADSLPILIHCEHGEGRSVLFSALYRIEIEGWGVEDARDETRVFEWRGGFAPGTGKGDYLMAYQRRRPSPAH